MASFRVDRVVEIPSRGRCVAGDIVAGALSVGMSLRPESHTSLGPWRICGVEFVLWVSQTTSQLALILENAPPVDELQRLLPAGSILVTDETDSKAKEPGAADDR